MNPIQRFGLWLAGTEQKSRTTSEAMPTWLHRQPFRPLTPSLTTEEAIRSGYRAGIVYACIRLLANTATSVPLRVYERAGDDWEANPNHPLQELLDHPNTLLTRRRLYMRAVQHLMLTGNAIFTKVRVPKSGPPTQLWPLNPDQVFPVPTEKNLVDHYELRVDGQRVRLEARDVIHLQLENPETPLWGVGPLQAAMLDVSLYRGNKAWNLRTVEGGAVTPGVLEIPDDITDEQYATLRKQLDDRTFGKDDAGRDLILGSGMKYHRMSLTGEELGFLESMRFGREEIAMIFGVPAPLLTPENATLANAEAYDQQFWNNTIVPLNVGIADILTQALVPEFTNRPHEVVLEHDYSQVPAMQPSLSLQAEVAERYIRSGFTPDGVNRVLDLGFEDHEIRHAPDEHSTIDGHVLPQSGHLPPEERSVKAAAADELKRLWTAADVSRTAWEEETAKRVSGLFQSEGTSVATAYRRHPTPEAARAAIEAHATNWRALLTALHTEVTRHYATSERDRLTSNRKAQPGSLDAVATWAREHAARQVTGITRTTIERIARVISDGLTPNEDGHHLTTDQIANRIADTYDSWVFTGPGPNLTIDQRAMMIARTEIGTAMNTGHTLGAQAAADELDLEMVKGWAASVDDRTRDTHLALHGETVPLNQAFSNGLQHPGDPDGPAEEIINCRCTVFHRVA